MSDIIESKRWSDEEEARLIECGPRAFMANTERTWHSVRSKYNYLKRTRAGQEMKVRPSVAPVAEVPEVTQVVGVTAHEPVDVTAIIDRAQQQYEKVAQKAERKANQHIHFDHGPIALFFVGDQHIGAPVSHI